MKRISFLDNVRSLAIFLVVLCHSIEFLYDGEALTVASPAMVNFSAIIFNFTRLGVPLFLFLSGYLLLDKDYKTEKDVFKFWKTKLLPVVITWVIWIVIFYLFKCWKDGLSFSVKDFVLKLFMVERVNVSHDWYMYMLIGLYFVFPFLSMFLKKFSLKMHLVVFGGAFFICMVIPSLAALTGKNVYLFSAVSSFFINTNYCYIIYAVLGFFLKKYEKLSFNLPINLIGFILSMTAMVLCGYYRHSIMLSYYLWYDFALLPFASVFLFNLLRGVKLPSFIEKVNGRISICSFGMYLVHVPILCVLIRFFPKFNSNQPLSSIVYLAIAFIASYVLVEIIGKIKYLNKYLFMIKNK